MATQPPAPPIWVPYNPDGTCPAGYQSDPPTNGCIATGAIFSSPTEFSLPEIDPKNAGQLTGLGLQDSTLAERFALAFWHTARRITKPQNPITSPPPPATGSWWHDQIVWAVSEVVNMYDWVISVGVNFVGDSATRNNPGFWHLIGALISDLLGVSLDGGTLYTQLQQRGTLAAMQGVGASLVNLLIGEFTGTASGTGGSVTFSTAVNPDTNLPEATLTPKGGVLAAQALMGFVLSSAVRQGNVEAVGTELGWLGGHVEKFSEAMRANLGIGRMLRFALRPIFQDLIALPMRWAIYKQYLPTMLNAAEAVRGWLAQDLTDGDLAELMARGGYAPKFALALRNQHTLNPPINDLLTLRASGTIGDAEFGLAMGRHGYSPSNLSLLTRASDFAPARRVSLALAEHYLLEFGKGALTAADFTGFIDQLKRTGWLLTVGEVQAIEGMAQALVITKKIRPRHLLIAQLTTAYIDGVLTLSDFQQHLVDAGFQPDDVLVETEVLLIKAKAAADAAAAKAAKIAAKANPPATTNPPTTG